MEEKRQSQRRVVGDRRKGKRRIRTATVETERRVTGERRKGEWRVLADRRKT